MRFQLARILSPFTAIVACSLFTSCGSIQQQGQATVHINLTGRAMGGEQPITAATVQLYQVGTSTDGGASAALINQTLHPVTTSDGSGQMNSNANAGNNNNQMAAGYFTITGDYTCPTSSTLVYIVTIGGNPGAGTNNAQEGMAAIGQCGSLTSNSFLTINEVTTVGTVRALSNYMTGYAAVGSTSAHAAAFARAFNTASEYVQIANGTAPGPYLPSGYNASDNDLRALANAVQYCVNSNGSVAHGSNCGTFFAAAQGSASTGPADTVTALLDIFADPTNNVPTIFGMQGSTPAFAPTNTSAPPDWTLPIIPIPGTPSISPAAGTYASAQTVTISDSDVTASIYYTTDGSTPSATNGTLYTGTISVSSNETISAIAIESSRLSSSVASASYTINNLLTQPTVSLASISTIYGSTTGVTLTATSNANGSVVTFGTAGSIGGSFSNSGICTIASGSCTVIYTPSGTLGVGTYTNDLTANFAATSTYGAANATGTLTVTTSYGFTLLHSFSGATSDGDDPRSGSLVQGADGNFYGTTQYGGANNAGTVFELVPNGTSSTVTILHSFAGGTSDGSQPDGGLVQGADGNFYGMTYNGGAYNDGTVFELVPNGTSSTITILHSFAGATSDGKNPFAGLVQGADGNFYGTTYSGGAYNVGTVFELVPNGTNSTVTILHSFGAAGDGSQPECFLLQGADGNFYGTTASGGANFDGTVFELVPNGASSTVTLLHSFAGTSDGQAPSGGLMQGSDGNFYGTTGQGGANNKGTVFKLVPNGTSSTLTVLHSFAGATSDGQSPSGVLLQGTDGNIYGTTDSGGANSDGTVFQLVPNGTSSTVTLLHSFAGTSDGNIAWGGLVQGADGNFYGTTYNGGSNSDGGLFEITVSPRLAAPVTITVPSSVTHSSSFTLSYAVSNAYAASPYSGTLEQCFAGVHDSSGNYTQLGTFTGSTASQNTTLTAPSVTGTYKLGVTCGGQESSTATLIVQ